MSAPRPTARSLRDRTRRLACWVVLLYVVTAVLGAAPARAEPLPDGVAWTVTVDGRSTETADAQNPLPLDPARPLPVVVRIENPSPVPVEARYVRLEGQVLGMAFFVFTTRVDLAALPGGRDERDFSVDLLDLGQQARGLIPAQVLLLDGRGDPIAAKPLVVDVKGSVVSVYGTFGLAVGAITAVLVATTLWRLATNTLPRNRWRRAVLMAAPGVGIGFVLTFTLSVLRFAAPVGALWAALLLLGAGGGFLAGYFSPTPDDDEDKDDDEDEDEDDEDKDDDEDEAPPEEPRDDAGKRDDQPESALP